MADSGSQNAILHLDCWRRLGNRSHRIGVCRDVDPLEEARGKEIKEMSEKTAKLCVSGDQAFRES